MLSPSGPAIGVVYAVFGSRITDALGDTTIRPTRTTWDPNCVGLCRGLFLVLVAQGFYRRLRICVFAYGACRAVN